jgi:hypothetical protein
MYCKVVLLFYWYRWFLLLAHEFLTGDFDLRHAHGFHDERCCRFFLLLAQQVEINTRCGCWDTMAGHRGSMDIMAAALNAAIMDLT